MLLLLLGLVLLASGGSGSASVIIFGCVLSSCSIHVRVIVVCWQSSGAGLFRGPPVPRPTNKHRKKVNSSLKINQHHCSPSHVQQNSYIIIKHYIFCRFLLYISLFSQFLSPARCGTCNLFYFILISSNCVDVCVQRKGICVEHAHNYSNESLSRKTELLATTL